MEAREQITEIQNALNAHSGVNKLNGYSMLTVGAMFVILIIFIAISACLPWNLYLSNEQLLLKENILDSKISNFHIAFAACNFFLVLMLNFLKGFFEKQIPNIVQQNNWLTKSISFYAFFLFAIFILHTIIERFHHIIPIGIYIFIIQLLAAAIYFTSSANNKNILHVFGLIIRAGCILSAFFYHNCLLILFVNIGIMQILFGLLIISGKSDNFSQGIFNILNLTKKRNYSRFEQR